MTFARIDGAAHITGMTNAITAADLQHYTLCDALRDELARLRISTKQFARLAGADYRRARRWVAGSADVPVSVVLMLEGLSPADARTLLENPREAI